MLRTPRSMRLCQVCIVRPCNFLSGRAKVKSVSSASALFEAHDSSAKAPTRALAINLRYYRTSTALQGSCPPASMLWRALTLISGTQHWLEGLLCADTNRMLCHKLTPAACCVTNRHQPHAMSQTACLPRRSRTLVCSPNSSAANLCPVPCPCQQCWNKCYQGGWATATDGPTFLYPHAQRGEQSWR